MRSAYSVSAGASPDFEPTARQERPGGLYDEGSRKWLISPIKCNKDSEDAFRARAGDAFKRNDWNTYRIDCRRKSLRIFVNGVLTADVEDTVDASGVLAIRICHTE